MNKTITRINSKLTNNRRFNINLTHLKMENWFTINNGKTILWY